MKLDRDSRGAGHRKRAKLSMRGHLAGWQIHLQIAQVDTAVSLYIGRVDHTTRRRLSRYARRRRTQVEVRRYRQSITSPLLHTAVDCPFIRASSPSRWNGGWLTMSSSVSSATSRKLAFTFPLVCRSVSIFADDRGRWLLVAVALLLALCWFGRPESRRTRQRRNPVIQQDLAFKLSARLQSRRHIRNLQMQRIGVYTRVKSNATRHHSRSRCTKRCRRAPFRRCGTLPPGLPPLGSALRFPPA